MSKLIKNALKNKDLKAYVKLSEDVGDEYLEVTTEELEAIMGQHVQFESIGMELEKHAYNARTIYINDEIAPETTSYIPQLINKWNSDDFGIAVDERMPITVYLNTPGGDAYSALNLMSSFENSITPVIGVVDGGMCMSAGIPVFLSTHYRIASRHSEFMYHELRAPLPQSTLKEIKNTAQFYERMQTKMDNFILENTKITQELLDEKKNSNLDWFIDADDLEELGIAHEVL